MQFSKYLLDGSTLNSKYLTGEKFNQWKNFVQFVANKIGKLAMIEYGIRTVGKNLFIRKFRQRWLKNVVLRRFAIFCNVA